LFPRRHKKIFTTKLYSRPLSFSSTRERDARLGSAISERYPKREQGVCNLDFDPIYNAQDFETETTNLQIAAVVGQPDLFNVTFTNLGTRTLVYRLTNTRIGWRISDIKYPEGPSLKEILSREIK
jgi:hypothetical protein